MFEQLYGEDINEPSSEDEDDDADGMMEMFETMVEERKGKRTRYQYSTYLTRIKEYINEKTKYSSLKDCPAKRVLKFVTSQCFKKDGTLKSPSTPEGFRSAILHYFEEEGLPTPIAYTEGLSKFLKGYSNKIADKIQCGEYKAKEGKDAFTAATFTKLSELAVADGNLNGQLFLILQWNLTIRAEQVETCNYQHISWAGDCLKIGIMKEKQRAAGVTKGNTHEMHVYSNPLCPFIDAFLSLGVKILSTPLLGVDKKVFDVKNIHDKYTKWLQSILTKINPEEAMRLGYEKNSSDFGTHSLRKGSISHSASSPGVCSIIAGILRGGWSLGGDLNRYIKPMITGDQNVGRVLCGLPPHLVEFSMLPARFQPNMFTIIKMSDIIPCYELYPSTFLPCLEFLLAAVVYHHDWLKESLPKEHDLFKSTYWTERKVLGLRPFLIEPSCMHCPVRRMNATGISPETSVLYELRYGNKQQQHQAQVPRTTNAFQTGYNPAFVGSSVSSGSASASDVNAISPTEQRVLALLDRIEQALPGVLANHGVEARNVIAATNINTTEFKLPTPLNESDWPMHCDILTLHNLWHGGNKEAKLPPYKTVKTFKLKGWSIAVGKAVSQATLVMNHLDLRLEMGLVAYLHCQDQAKKNSEQIKAYNSLCEDIHKSVHKSSTEWLRANLVRLNYTTVCEGYVRGKI